MPRGPRGEKRPADAIGAAIMVGRISIGEADDPKTDKNPHAVALGKAGGAKGGKARAANLSPKKRKEIATKAAKARWAEKGK
jgi:hypothetical protein